MPLTPKKKSSPTAEGGDVKIAIGGAGVASVKGVDDIIAKLPAEKASLRVTLSLQISGRLARVSLKPEGTDGLSLLAPFFKAVLPKPESEIVTPGGSKSAYNIRGFGRCWQIIPGLHARLEFWYPYAERLTDSEVNSLIYALLSALGSGVAAMPMGTVHGSMETLEPRDYKLAFTPQSMDLRLAAECCKRFLDATGTISGIVFNDKITICDKPGPATHSGLMLFGPKSSAEGKSLASPGSSSGYNSSLSLEGGR